MSVEERVRRHFHADAYRFDAIYDDRKSPLHRFIDGVWRGVVRKRFELTLQRLAPIEGRSILDVGCGSGRYCLAYASAGADRVVGIDFADAMIDLANKHARDQGVANRCRFIAGTFPADAPPGPYDHVTAMGFFDYIADPAALISAITQVTRSTMIMSFPKAREWRVPIRRLRFWLAGCPLYLYSRRTVDELLRAAGVRQWEIVELDRDYIVVAQGSAA